MTLPAIVPNAAAAAAGLTKLGLKPTTVLGFSEVPKGMVFGTLPAPGASAPPGTIVQVEVSAGFPLMAYDNDADVLLANGATGKRLAAVAKTSKQEKSPSWNATGTAIAYVSGDRLMLEDLSQANQMPTALTAAGERYADPSFAPSAAQPVLASSRLNSPTDRNDTDLCVGQVTSDGYKPSCIEDKRFGIGAASWSADGTQLLVPAVGKNGAGIVRYRSKTPFSPRAADWGTGHFVTARDAQGGTAVIAAALSPDGKTLAAVANLDSDQFRLYLTKPGDLGLQHATPLNVQACKVTWLADSQQVVITQLGDQCDQATGQISRLSLSDPTNLIALAAGGDNPSLQPLSLRG